MELELEELLELEVTQEWVAEEGDPDPAPAWVDAYEF